MVQIYIVRHAETIGNIEKRLTGREDYEISKYGQVSIEKLRKRFEKVKLDKIYSSPSGRAKKTVLPISIEKDIQIIEKNELYEMYFGIYDGWKWEEVNKINPRINELHEQTNEIMQIPNQETTEQVAKRMYNFIYEVAKENSNKTILIASHGVAIEAFLRTVTKEELLNKREEYSQHNTCINKVIFEETTNQFKLNILNDISHLKEKGKDEENEF